MLTLQELRDMTDIPVQGAKTLTAKKLRETGKVVVKRQIRDDTWIVVYRNGYAAYYACDHVTVFSIHACRDYLYASNGMGSFLSERYFEKEPWYVRLVLEGEDRIERNQMAKEQEHMVSYNAISEEWGIMKATGTDPLERLIDRENQEEILQYLSERQREAVNLCCVQQKTRKEAAGVLGISSSAVSVRISQAARRLSGKYQFADRMGKRVASV